MELNFCINIIAFSFAATSFFSESAFSLLMLPVGSLCVAVVHASFVTLAADGVVAIFARRQKFSLF